MVARTKIFIADFLQPLATPDGQSLEEQVNTFLSSVSIASVLDVRFNLSKTGRYGENPVFVAWVFYKS